MSTQKDLARPAVASPFGLMADLGAAVAVELGVPVSQIAAGLGPVAGGPVGDRQALAAIVRGRQELVARRADRARFRPDKPGRRAPVRELPEPNTAAHSDRIEALLQWADRGPQRAATLAAKARLLLEEIAAIQQTTRWRWTSRKLALNLPPNATSAQRLAYLAEVRVWALRSGFSPPQNLPLSRHIIHEFREAQAAARREPAAPDEPAAVDEQGAQAPVDRPRPG